MFVWLSCSRRSRRFPKVHNLPLESDQFLTTLNCFLNRSHHMSLRPQITTNVPPNSELEREILIAEALDRADDNRLQQEASQMAQSNASGAWETIRERRDTPPGFENDYPADDMPKDRRGDSPGVSASSSRESKNVETITQELFLDAYRTATRERPTQQWCELNAPVNYLLPLSGSA